MEARLHPAGDSDLLWIESAVRTCPTSMTEFGGFYAHASTKLPSLIGADRELLIIRCHARRLGFVDVEGERAAGLHLTYFVDPAERQKGIGLRALDLVARRAHSSCLLVSIRPDNVASLALARRAGFLEVGSNKWGEIRITRTPTAVDQQPCTLSRDRVE